MAISVPTSTASRENDDIDGRQIRQYGRTCPAVRRHALRKKRAAAAAAADGTNDK